MPYAICVIYVCMIHMGESRGIIPPYKLNMLLTVYSLKANSPIATSYACAGCFAGWNLCAPPECHSMIPALVVCSTCPSVCHAREQPFGPSCHSRRHWRDAGTTLLFYALRFLYNTLTTTLSFQHIRYETYQAILSSTLCEDGKTHHLFAICTLVRKPTYRSARPFLPRARRSRYAATCMVSTTTS